MQQFLLALLLVLGGLSYYLWNENGVLKENNAKLEVAIQTQLETGPSWLSFFLVAITDIGPSFVESS